MKAREMRPGDVWHLHDWPLHVIAVDVQGDNVALLTGELGDLDGEGHSMHHVPADEIEEVDRS